MPFFGLFVRRMEFAIEKNWIFGGAAISGEGKGYGFGPCSEKEAENLLKLSYERGVRYFDVAPVYGYGLAEQRMGRYLPLDAKILTKGGVFWHPNRRIDISNAPHILKNMVEESLKRLKRPIYCYFIHWPDPKVSTASAISTLIPYIKRGDIQKLGLSNCTAEDLKNANEVWPIAYVQIEGSYLHTESKKSFDQILRNTTTKPYFQSWGTLKKGILSGRVNMSRKFHPWDARSWAPWWKKLPLSRLIDQAEPFLHCARMHQLSPCQLAMAYNLIELSFDQVVVGCRNATDLEDALSFFSRPYDMFFKAIKSLRQLDLAH